MPLPFLATAGGAAVISGVSGLLKGIFGLFSAGAQRKHERRLQQGAMQEAQKARDWEVMMRNAQRPDWMKTSQWNEGMMRGADRRLELGNVGGETGWTKRDPSSYIGSSALDALRQKLAEQSMAQGG